MHGCWTENDTSGQKYEIYMYLENPLLEDYRLVRLTPRNNDLIEDTDQESSNFSPNYLQCLDPSNVQ